MRLGHSNLLGELIEATGIDYDDCRHFQIVCPSCREPVFKVVRDAPEHPIHYLSHYGVDEAYAKDCELRVANISDRDIQATNAAARGQTLALFLRVLRDVIVTSQYPEQSRIRVEAFARQFRESKSLRQYRDVMFEHAYETFRGVSLDDAAEILQGYIDDVTTDGSEFPRTAFSIATQQRIAWDVWRHVLSPAARGNYFFLLSHGIMYLITRLELALNSRQLFEYEDTILQTLRLFVNSPTIPEVDQAFDRLLSTYVAPPYSLERMEVFTKMSAEITHESLGILLRLPYFDLLKNR